MVWAGYATNQIPAGARFSAPVQTSPRAQQPPVQRVSGLFPGVNGHGHGANCPPLASTMLNKQWTHNSIPHLGLHGLLYGELYRLTLPHVIWYKKIKTTDYI